MTASERPGGFTGDRHEWHVSGDTGPDWPPYHFTWSDPVSEVAERTARAFMDQAGFRGGHVTNVRLWHRVVTFRPWEEIPGDGGPE